MRNLLIVSITHFSLSFSLLAGDNPYASHKQRSFSTGRPCALVFSGGNATGFHDQLTHPSFPDLSVNLSIHRGGIRPEEINPDALVITAEPNLRPFVRSVVCTAIGCALGMGVPFAASTYGANFSGEMDAITARVLIYSTAGAVALGSFTTLILPRILTRAAESQTIENIVDEVSRLAANTQGAGSAIFVVIEPSYFSKIRKQLHKQGFVSNMLID